MTSLSLCKKIENFNNQYQPILLGSNKHVQWILQENNILSLIMQNKWTLESFLCFQVPEFGKMCQNFYICMTFPGEM